MTIKYELTFYVCHGVSLTLTIDVAASHPNPDAAATEAAAVLGRNMGIAHTHTTRK